jgi:hypothetical protein
MRVAVTLALCGQALPACLGLVWVTPAQTLQVLLGGMWRLMAATHAHAVSAISKSLCKPSRAKKP